MKAKMDLATAHRMKKSPNKKTARRALAVIKEHNKMKRIATIRGEY